MQSKTLRREDQRLLTGKGTFIDDVKMDGILYAHILRSPYAHARVVSIDTRAALRLSGVVEVLTGEGVAAVAKPFGPIKNYSIATDKVRYVGEPVAIAVATNKGIAEDAAELIDVSYDPLPAVTDPEQAMKPSAPILHSDFGSNIAWHREFVYGDVEESFKRADRVVKKTINFHRYSATPMETSGVIASYDSKTGMLTFWYNGSSALPTATVASTLGIPREKVRVISGDIGGSFGVKSGLFVYIVLIAVAAMKCGRPVKWTEERREHISGLRHHPNRRTFVEAAVKSDGEILGLKLKVIDDIGAYFRPAEPHSIIKGMAVLPGCYRIKSLSLDAYSIMTNKCPTAAIRGFGLQHHYFTIERMVDLIAAELKMDRAEIRLRNFIQPDEFPYTIPAGSVYDSGNYPGTFTRAMDLIRYRELAKEQQKLRRDGRYIGIGFSCIVEPGVPNFGFMRLVTPDFPLTGASEAATIKMDRNGAVTLLLGTRPQGQGHETVAAQIAAAELGIGSDEVYVEPIFDTLTHPSTDLSGTYGSRFGGIGMSTVSGASKKLKEKLAAIASIMLDARTQDLVFEDGRIRFKGFRERSVSIKEVAARAYSAPLPGITPGLELTHVEEFPFPGLKLPDEKGRLNIYGAYGNSADAAAVEVDVETGTVKLLRYVVVGDAGRIINHQIAEGQVQGGIAHGIGGALYEEVPYDSSGQPLATSFMDYLIPTAEEIPNIRVEHLESPSPLTALGTKGLGEGGAMSAPSCVANAVADALAPFGVKIVGLPLIPEKIWKAIHSKEALIS